MDTNKKISKLLKSFIILLHLNEFRMYIHFYCVSDYCKDVWMEICCCHKAVANDDLLSFCSTNRKNTIGSQYPFANRPTGNQWQSMVYLPMAPMIKLLLFSVTTFNDMNTWSQTTVRD